MPTPAARLSGTLLTVPHLTRASSQSQSNKRGALRILCVNRLGVYESFPFRLREAPFFCRTLRAMRIRTIGPGLLTAVVVALGSGCRETPPPPSPPPAAPAAAT